MSTVKQRQNYDKLQLLKYDHVLKKIKYLAMNLVVISTYWTDLDYT